MARKASSGGITSETPPKPDPITPKPEPITPKPEPITPKPEPKEPSSTEMTVTQENSVLELYSAYFNRAADANGFNFWKNSFKSYIKGADANATENDRTLFSLEKIATDMTSSSEYKGLYPSSQSISDFIDAIYTNLLNRPSDAGGLDFWSGHIERGTMSREQAITKMIAGAKANTSDQGKIDAALMANKNTVSKYFATELKSDDMTKSEKAFSKVTADPASVQSAVNDLDQNQTAGAIQSKDTETTGVVTVEETKIIENPIIKKILKENIPVKETIENPIIKKILKENIPVKETIENPIITTISIKDIPVDDYSNNINTTGHLIINAQAINGKFETNKDSDWFKTDLIQGQAYLIDYKSHDKFEIGIATSATMQVINKDGQIMITDVGFYSAHRQKSFIPTESGEYYISMSDNGFTQLSQSEPGAYEISIQITEIPTGYFL